MNTITDRPTLFAVNSHHNEHGEWVGNGNSYGMSVEPKVGGVEVVIGCRHEADNMYLTHSESHQLALWLLAAIEPQGD